MNLPGIRILLLSLVTLSGSCGSVLAIELQSQTNRYGVVEWNMQSGLPQNTVHSINQTDDGYLWVGTDDGLARFDGVKFSIVDDHNSELFENDGIRNIHKSRDGTLWISTDGPGILWNQNGPFSKAPYPELEQHRITAFLEDRDGMLVATPSGLFHCSGNLIDPIQINWNIPLRNIQSLARDQQGRLWISAETSWLYTPDQDMVPFRSLGIEGNSTALAPSKKGGMWVGTTQGLYHYNEGKVQFYNTGNGLNSEDIHAVLEDHNGTLWVGTNNGLQCLINHRWSTIRFRWGEALGSVISLFEDVEGNIWAGTFSGLLNVREMKVLSIGTEDGLSHASVQTVLEARDRSVWIGTFGGGLNRMLPDGRIDVYRQNGLLLEDYVCSLSETQDGALWISYRGSGLSRLQNGQIRHYGIEDGLPNDPVRATAVDAEGCLWFVGDSTGLWRASGDTFEQVPAKRLSSSMQALLFDSQGNLWVGAENGVGRRSPDGNWEVWTEQQGLRGSTTYSLLEDDRGNIWIARKDGSIQRICNDQLQYFPFPENPTMSIMGLLHTPGELWMYGARGIYRVKMDDFDAIATGVRSTFDSTVFDEYYGGKQSAPSIGGYPGTARLSSGELWFCSNNGISQIHPGRIPVNGFPPKVMIESIVYEREPLGYSGQMLTLPPAKSAIEFHFTATGLTDAKRNRFKYRMIGVDQDWIDAGTNRVATYAGLKPGKHRFQVIAANNDGAWSRIPATCAFELRPHFSQTFWFWTLVTLAATAVLAGIYRWRVGAIHRREIKLQMLVNQQTEDLTKAKENAGSGKSGKK